MAMYDKNNLIDDAVTVTASGQSAWKDLGAAPASGHHYRLSITASQGTNPTADVQLEFSDDASTVKEKHVVPQIVAADVGTDKLITVAVPRRYVRRNCTAVGGTSTPGFTWTLGIEGGDYNAKR